MSSSAIAEICVLQHEADAPAGLIEEWLGRRGLAHRKLRPDLGEPVPEDPSAWRRLVLLGSEHSVNSPDPAWIGAELELTRRAIAQDVPVLGICFGGQMLARAMGAAVKAAERPTIGWGDVSADGPSAAAGSWLFFNYERFALPAGAEQLGEHAGEPAAFRSGLHLGVQFHPEATVEIVHGWARWDAERLSRLGLDPARLIETTAERRRDARERAMRLFDSWITDN